MTGEKLLAGLCDVGRVTKLSVESRYFFSDNVNSIIFITV